MKEQTRSENLCGNRFEGGNEIRYSSRHSWQLHHPQCHRREVVSTIASHATSPAPPASPLQGNHLLAIIWGSITSIISIAITSKAGQQGRSPAMAVTVSTALKNRRVSGIYTYHGDRVRNVEGLATPTAHRLPLSQRGFGDQQQWRYYDRFPWHALVIRTAWKHF